MPQSRLMSLVEALANVAVGFGVAVLTQVIVFPMFGLTTTLAQNLKLGLIFTGVSILRSYALRRAFEAFRQSRPPPRAERDRRARLRMRRGDLMRERKLKATTLKLLERNPGKWPVRRSEPPPPRQPSRPHTSRHHDEPWTTCGEFNPTSK